MIPFFSFASWDEREEIKIHRIETRKVRILKAKFLRKTTASKHKTYPSLFPLQETDSKFPEGRDIAQ